MTAWSHSPPWGGASNAIAHVVEFAFGAVLHFFLFRFGEWHLHTLRLICGVLVLNTAATLKLISLQPAGEESWRSAATTVGYHACTVFAGTYTSLFLYRAFFHRLKRFPGPFLARISNLYLTFLASRNVCLFEELQRLHQRYGDFVRIGPSVVSIIDPLAPTIVHSSTTTCSKGPFYDGLHPKTNLHLSRDKAEHSRRRKIWDRGFTPKAMRSFEPQVVHYTEELLKAINARTGSVVDAALWFNFYSFDIMGDMAFGKSFGMLKEGKPHAFMRYAHEFMVIIASLGHLLWLVLPLRSLPGISNSEKRFWNWLSEQVEARRKMSIDRFDVLSWLLQEYEAIEDKTQQDQHNIVAEALLIIVAGSDTTAATLTCLFFELARHPEVQCQLQAELDAHHNEIEGLGFDCESLANLPYLKAVINETLRMHPAVPSSFERVTPSQGLQIGETYIPGDIIIKTPLYLIMRDERNFTSAQDFIPERWTTRKKLTKDIKNYIPFLLGRYSCIGKPVALMELYLVTATLMKAFNVKLAPDQTCEEFYKGRKDTVILKLEKLNLIFTNRLE